jgi:hypothetical protein
MVMLTVTTALAAHAANLAIISRKLSLFPPADLCFTRLSATVNTITTTQEFNIRAQRKGTWLAAGKGTSCDWSSQKLRQS